MKRATFSTPGANRLACSAAISSALATVSGVVKAQVDLESRQVQVTFDEDLASPERLVQAIGEAGYEVTAVCIRA